MHKKNNKKPKLYKNFGKIFLKKKEVGNELPKSDLEMTRDYTRLQNQSNRSATIDLLLKYIIVNKYRHI